MRLLIFIGILSCLSTLGQTQEQMSTSSIGQITPIRKAIFDHLELRYYTGKIKPHHEKMEHWRSYSTRGLELRLGKQSRGQAYWECAYQYPTYGLSIYWMTTGNDTLGQTGALAGFMTFPLFRRPRLVAGLELTSGLAAGFNPNDPISNPNNYAIGSYLNFYFNFGAYFDYRLSQQFTLASGVSLVHFSNASARAPNLGINLLHYHLGLRYHFQSGFDRQYRPRLSAPNGEDASGFLTLEKPQLQKRWGMHSFFAAGFRQTEWTGGTHYGIMNFTTDLTYHLIPISKLVFGFDLMYDASNVQFYRDELAQGIPHDPDNNYFAGVHLGHELHINRIAIILHVGHYLLKPEKVFEIYGRMGIRCQVGENWWSNVSFKVHNYTTAQYIEWGFGRNLF